jgi:hypothetical protein
MAWLTTMQHSGCGLAKVSWTWYSWPAVSAVIIVFIVWQLCLQLFYWYSVASSVSSCHTDIVWPAVSAVVLVVIVWPAVSPVFLLIWCDQLCLQVSYRYSMASWVCSCPSCYSVARCVSSFSNYIMWPAVSAVFLVILCGQPCLQLSYLYCVASCVCICPTCICDQLCLQLSSLYSEASCVSSCPTYIVWAAVSTVVLLI